MDLRELENTKNTESRHPWEIARLFVIQSKIKQIFNENDEKVILDIGCGDTWLIEQLSKKFPNFKFIAVDTAFDSGMLKKLNSKLNSKTFSVFKTLDSALNDNNKKIDLILLLDVIEHIEDDIAFLKWVNSFNNINNQTKFLITVPAFQFLFSEHDVFLGHYRRYDNKKLKLHIDQSGLKTIRIGYFFSSLLTPRVLTKVKEGFIKPKQNVTGIGGWKKTPIDKLFVVLLIMDYKLSRFFEKISISLPGLSNYVLCKQK